MQLGAIKQHVVDVPDAFDDVIVAGSRAALVWTPSAPRLNRSEIAALVLFSVALHSALAYRLAHSSASPALVHVNADRDVKYGLVAKTMSAVDRAGVTKLSVLTTTE
jgi:hypothetical protein